ncbi:hypothetical protein P7C70_g6996, partial [Phenoliferia sp. Uapishka_3]
MRELRNQETYREWFLRRGFSEDRIPEDFRALTREGNSKTDWTPEAIKQRFCSLYTAASIDAYEEKLYNNEDLRNDPRTEPTMVMLRDKAKELATLYSTSSCTASMLFVISIFDGEYLNLSQMLDLPRPPDLMGVYIYMARVCKQRGGNPSLKGSVVVYGGHGEMWQRMMKHQRSLNKHDQDAKSMLIVGKDDVDEELVIGRGYASGGDDEYPSSTSVYTFALFDLSWTDEVPLSRGSKYWSSVGESITFRALNLAKRAAEWGEQHTLEDLGGRQPVPGLIKLNTTGSFW